METDNLVLLTDVGWQDIILTVSKSNHIRMLMTAVIFFIANLKFLLHTFNQEIAQLRNPNAKETGSHISY